LPGDSDKASIYINIIEHHQTLNQIAFKNGQPKQLIAFLSPTKTLLKRHKKYIACNSEVVVRAYTGECSKIRHTSHEIKEEIESESVEKFTYGVEKEGQKVNIMSWEADMWREEAAEVGKNTVSGH
jgi:hypothetical protein